MPLDAGLAETLCRALCHNLAMLAAATVPDWMQSVTTISLHELELDYTRVVTGCWLYLAARIPSIFAVPT